MTKKKIKLISITKGSGGKKLKAKFERNGRTITRQFGAAGMSDYTKHKDKQRRNRYIKRHLKDLRTGDPTKAGYLSMFVLWNKPSLSASKADYKRRLNTYNRTGRFPKKISGYSPSDTKSKKKSSRRRRRKRSPRRRRKRRRSPRRRRRRSPRRRRSRRRRSRRRR